MRGSYVGLALGCHGEHQVDAHSHVRKCKTYIIFLLEWFFVKVMDDSYYGKKGCCMVGSWSVQYRKAGISDVRIVSAHSTCMAG